MKKSFVLVVVLFVLSALSGCSTAHDREVIAVGKTGSYHRPGCFLIQMAKGTPMTVAEARAEKLKPCPGCKPDTI